MCLILFRPQSSPPVSLDGRYLAIYFYRLLMIPCNWQSQVRVYLSTERSTNYFNETVTLFFAAQ